MLWVSIIGYFSYDEFKRTMWPPNFGELVLPLDCAATRGQETTDFEQRDGKCWYTMSTLRRLFPEYNDLNDESLGDRMYKKAGMPGALESEFRDAKMEGLALMVKYVLLPPVLVLAFGWALLWAIDGFRSR